MLPACEVEHSNAIAVDVMNHRLCTIATMEHKRLKEVKRILCPYQHTGQKVPDRVHRSCYHCLKVA